MSSNEPTLDQLRVLEAIARFGSFSAAARELRRATSALSYAIKNLEEGIGVELFDRSAHRATLTPAGQRLVDEAKRVLEQSAAFRDVAEHLRQGWEPRLEVVLDGILPLAPVMRAVRGFSELGSPTRMMLRTEFLGGVVEAFEHHKAHLMVTLGLEAEDAALRLVPLPPLEVVLVAHASHPLTGHERPRTRDDLRSHVELRVTDSARKRSAVPRPVAPLSESSFRLPDFHAKRDALLEGVGFGWLPRHLADVPLREGRLAPVPFEEGFRRRFRPRLAYRRESPLGRSASLFVEGLMAQLETATRRGRLR